LRKQHGDAHRLVVWIVGEMTTQPTEAPDEMLVGLGWRCKNCRNEALEPLTKESIGSGSRVSASSTRARSNQSSVSYHIRQLYSKGQNNESRFRLVPKGETHQCIRKYECQKQQRQQQQHTLKTCGMSPIQVYTARTLEHALACIEKKPIYRICMKSGRVPDIPTGTAFWW